MTNIELLKLNPQHLDELRSFFPGNQFTEVDILASEVIKCGDSEERKLTDFDIALRGLSLAGVFRGTAHTHVVFYGDEDDTTYCVSCAKTDDGEEHVIFKLTR